MKRIKSNYKALTTPREISKKDNFTIFGTIFGKKIKLNISWELCGPGDNSSEIINLITMETNRIILYFV